MNLAVVLAVLAVNVWIVAASPCAVTIGSLAIAAAAVGYLLGCRATRRGEDALVAAVAAELTQRRINGRQTLVLTPRREGAKGDCP